MQNCRQLISAAVFMAVSLGGGVAFAASDASSSGGTSVQATTAVAAPIASSQTASIISSAVSSGIGGSGFSGGGGFTPSGGGFTPSGGAPGTGVPAPGNGASLNDGSANTAQVMPFVSTRQQGRSGGNESTSMGLWTQASATRVSKTEDALKMHGYVYNLVGGIDKRFDFGGVLGLAASVERVDLVTAYNNGDFQGQGLSLAPYFGMPLAPWLNWDVSAGYGWLSYDVSRSGGSITGGYDAQRLFGATNLTANASVDQFRFQPSVGLNYSREHQDAFVESDGSQAGASTSDAGRLTVGTKIGYAMGYGIPYVRVAGQWDFVTPDQVLKSNGSLSDDSKYGGVMGLGYEYSKDGITASSELSYNSLLRDDFDLWGLTMRLRWDF